MKIPAFLKFSLLTLGILTSQSSAVLYNTPVDTEYGKVQGCKYFNSSTSQKYFNLPDSHIAAFLGIPYAADTAYQNRWKPAQRRQPWNSTLKAHEFGPSCPTSHQAITYNISEDCLRVNVWTPANSSADGLPVLVWSYGSGETSTEPRYDGGGLATKDVVVVTYNYRDAAFGFLAHPSLNEESGYNSSGNYGIMDFFTVLQWVQNNIVNFGGDPEKVTIAGQSFGSAQVYHAVNSPLAKGLFRGMIAESGIRHPYDPLLAGLADSYQKMEKAVENGINYTTFHNVSTIAELRTLSMEQLLIGSDDRQAIDNLTALWAMNPPLFKTTMDGYVVPKKYIDSLRDGPANDVPMIAGNNKDESGASTSTNYTVKEYLEYNGQWYGNLTSRFLELYPARNDSEADRSWNAASRDLSLVSSYQFANGWVESAKSPFYTYYWDHAPPGQSQGAFHMAEITYALKNLYKTNLPWTDYDFYLADVISSYWANFVKTGDPNSGGSYGNGSLTRWAPNKSEKPTVMHLGDGFGEIPIATRERRELLSVFLKRHEPY
ncbi:alpha/beta-hydrolase [Aspergillus steynii IBT 23096]|uniref:Alpha/beta-hydrolase n=1 Tax=Aspergillus steynii IBT 23096 TaxID=1392250 RepID=A0A2I2G3V5_9EURO|nr:alpha/beta-hydrolase [Aspergillus steynii IBT 23096]PLB47560.1 alpha/beta-hydrolase [Aspergillus steynii IBT 23096]